MEISKAVQIEVFSVLVAVGLSGFGVEVLRRFRVHRQKERKDALQKSFQMLSETLDGSKKRDWPKRVPPSHKKRPTGMTTQELLLTQGEFALAVKALIAMGDTATPEFRRNLTLRYWRNCWKLREQVIRVCGPVNFEEALPFSVIDNAQDWETMLDVAYADGGIKAVARLINRRSPRVEYVRRWVRQYTRQLNTADIARFQKECSSAFSPTTFHLLFLKNPDS